MRGHEGFVKQDANLSSPAADDLHFGDIVDLFDLIVNLRGDASQCEMVVAITRKRQRQNRHVVNRAWLDQRL